MIGINCLLKNTLLEKEMRNLVRYMGYDKVANGKDASLQDIYKDLRKAGVEVDLPTIGQMYADELPIHEDFFTSRKDIDSIVGRSFENRVRNLMLRTPKEGEHQIGKEGLGEHVAGRLMDTLYNHMAEDHTTESTMKQLRDAVLGAAERLTGDIPEKKGTKTDQEHFKDTLSRYFDQEGIGYDTLEGKTNNIHDLYAEALHELNRYKDKVDGGNDQLLKDQLAEHVKALETATNSLLFSREDARNVLHGSLIEGGYGKTVKGGKEILDWNKLAGGLRDISQLRDNVKDTMIKNGYSQETATRIADSLQKEYSDMKGRILERQMNKFQAMKDSIAKGQGSLPRVEVNDMINKRLDEWDNYKTLSGDNNTDLVFSRKQAKDILVSALKTEGYGKELPNGKVVLNWSALSREVKSDDAIHSKVMEMVTRQGHSPDIAQKVADAIQGLYGEMRQEIIDHATNRLNSLQDSIGKVKPGTRSELSRLSELHDLGIFNGDYEKLLNHRLGINSVSQTDIEQMKSIAQKASDLTTDLGGKDYLGSYAFSVFQKEIESVMARNRDNRSNLLKTTKIFGDIMGATNMGIIANPVNLVENNWSGLRGILTANLDVLVHMGPKAMFGDGGLFRAVWADVAKGGVEYGSAGDKLAHISDFMSKLNTLNFKKNPIKALGTTLIIQQRAFLNGSDAAFKAVVHKKSMMLAMHQSLIQGAGMSKSEATHLLNEALYGKSFEQAKVDAATILQKYGMKDNDATRTRLANDLVIGNLNLDGRLTIDNLTTQDIIESAINSGFHTAAIELGHEANNAISKTIQAGKSNARQKENDLIKQGEFGKASYQRAMNNVFYNGVLRFIGGGANWAILRLHSTGLGIATGYMSKDVNSELDFSDRETLQRTMENRLKANREVARGVVGLSVSAMAIGLLYAYGSQQDKEGDESNLEATSRVIKDSYIKNRMMTKIAPDIAQMYYLMETSKGVGHQAALSGSIKYLQGLANIGTDYTIGGKIAKVDRESKQGEKGYMHAMGDLGSILGDMFNTPFYRSGKLSYSIVNYWAGGETIDSKFNRPMSVFDGMLGGGMLEDIGVYKPSAPIELLPGVGNKKAAEFRKDGIETIDDLKNHPHWQNRINKKNRAGAEKMVADMSEE